MTTCTCGATCPRDAIAEWRNRAMPILLRWVAHGHRVNAATMMRTMELVCLMDKGSEQCFAPENRHHSHHRKDCPAAPRNQGRIDRPPKPAHEQPVHLSVERVRAWRESVERFMSIPLRSA